MGDGAGTSRRTVLGAAGVGAFAAIGVATGVGRSPASPVTRVGLFAETLALRGPGDVVEVGGPGQPALGALVPGTRVLRDAVDVRSLVAAERAWLDAGAAWTRAPGRWADLTGTALLDLHVLSRPDGGQLAGWTPPWRYVWPRDAAHVAAALVATGHAEEAAGVVRYLARAQGGDGWFEARYVPDGQGPPDGRPRQLDGTGWALWAAATLAAALSRSAGSALARAARPMVERGADLLLRLTDSGRRLPPAAPDYWERSEDAVTLGTVAPTLLGLRSAATLFVLLGEESRAAAAASAAGRLHDLTMSTFGAQGFPRHPGADDPDAALAFLAPPYAAFPGPAVAAALPVTERRMQRTGGGVAPGSSWRDDGISWTPETALLALAYAGVGRRSDAERILGWLEAHRTRGGSLPEKVLYDGSPASVAPLGWTAALVLLTISRLREPPEAT